MIMNHTLGLYLKYNNKKRRISFWMIRNPYCSFKFLLMVSQIRIRKFYYFSKLDARNCNIIHILPRYITDILSNILPTYYQYITNILQIILVWYITKPKSGRNCLNSPMICPIISEKGTHTFLSLSFELNINVYLIS